jgi:hypothetical protein
LSVVMVVVVVVVVVVFGIICGSGSIASAIDAMGRPIFLCLLIARKLD